MIIQKPIGLFFGSFNPIHVGHLIIANYMLEFANIDQVWFVVSPQNPLKEKKTLINDRQRMKMVKLAINSNPNFKACNVEFKLPKPSYTSYALEVMEEKYPVYKFSLMIGSDNLVNFDKWRNHKQIIENYQLLVYPRPGFTESPLTKHKNVSMINAPLMELSSSFIRQCIAEKRNVEYYLPLRVFNHINRENLYK